MERTKDKSRNFWEGFEDVLSVMDGGGLDYFETRFASGEEVKLLPRIEEWIDTWGRGRGIEFARHEITGRPHPDFDFEEIVCTSFFAPAFESNAQLMRALEEEDKVI